MAEMNVDEQPFQRADQHAREWTAEVQKALGTDSTHRAWLALRTVLHAVRDRLPVTEVAQLGAELPMLVRGELYSGWAPARRRKRERRLQPFLEQIRAAFRDEPDVDPASIARTVFSVLQSRISAGEMEDIRRLLPKHLGELWPDRGAASREGGEADPSEQPSGNDGAGVPG